MKINSLTIKNFRGFEEKSFEFSTSFNLLVGKNASGKTATLSALALVAESSLIGFPGDNFKMSYIFKGSDVRLSAHCSGDTVNLERQYPVNLTAQITLNDAPDEPFEMTRYFDGTSADVNEKGAIDPQTVISKTWNIAKKIANGESFPLSLIGYYGTRRSEWKSLDDFKLKSPNALEEWNSKSRLEGYNQCLDPCPSVKKLVQWIGIQDWISYQEKQKTQSLLVVKKAILAGLEGAEDIFFDAKRGEVIVNLGQNEIQPLQNLSDGQRSMLALIGDMAIRAITLNPYLKENVLTETPGVVLIDELDLHLHPSWQRRIARNLQNIFPKVQFFCTTHSPQVLGQIHSESIIILDDNKNPGKSFGMDSNWILKYIMNSDDRDPIVEKKIIDIFDDIDNERFEQVKPKISALREEIGTHADLVEAEALAFRNTRSMDLDGENTI